MPIESDLTLFSAHYVMVMDKNEKLLFGSIRRLAGTREPPKYIEIAKNFGRVIHVGEVFPLYSLMKEPPWRMIARIRIMRIDDSIIHFEEE